VKTAERSGRLGTESPRFAMFRGAPGLARVRDAWAEIQERISEPGVAHLFPWHESYVTYLETEPSSLRCYVSYVGDAPTGIFPLKTGRRRFGGVTLSTLEIPHDSHFCLSDFVFPRTAANAGLVAALVDHLVDHADVPWDVIVLPNILEDAAAQFSLLAVPPRRKITQRVMDCHYIVCADFHEGLGKSTRRHLGKARKRLAQEGRLEFLDVRSPAQIARAFEEFMAVECSGWKGAAGTAIQCDSRLVKFYEHAARELAKTGAVQIDRLTLDGKCIAAQYSVKSGRSLYALKSGYDENYAAFSPSNILFDAVVRDCLERGDTEVVNLISDSAWQHAWRPRHYERFTTFVFNRSLRGQIGYLSLLGKGLVPATLKNSVRRLMERLRRGGPSTDRTHRREPSPSAPSGYEVTR
jgi:CelD/BcsL family acetyltransferase involved in cellulose biosynthesis